MFITLSCAEYFWPDIKRLLKERLKYTDVDTDAPDFNYLKATNDYTLVVQEYFQQRVEIWLETVGKNIFGIEYHWLRYEFAPSRGQIHVHMLAVSCFNKIYNKVKDIDPENQATFLADMVQESFSLTASIENDYSPPKSREKHPANFYYGEVLNKADDAKECLWYMQQHVCSEYCLTTIKNGYVPFTSSP